MKTYRPIIFLLISASIYISGCAFISIPIFSPVQPLEERILNGKGENKILVIDISGFISESEQRGTLGMAGPPSTISRVKEEIKLAEKDRYIKGIIIKINSPGGTVTASDIIYNELVNLKKRMNIPVVASLMGISASGGYYIAASADKIVAHPTTITGSIGVIAVNLNVSELMNKIGIRDQTVKSGENKDMMSPFRPANAQERKIMSRIINTLHERFVQVVAGARRELTVEDVKKIADGRIYTAEEALDLHLIDKIGYMDDAVALIKEEAGIRDGKVITYTRPLTYKNNIYSSAAFTSENRGDGGINISLGFPRLNVSPGFLYLWQP